MAAVPSIMSPADSVSPGRRPARSEYAPITIAPSGRASQEMANAPSESSRDTSGFAAGKNCRPSTAANRA